LEPVTAWQERACQDAHRQPCRPAGGRTWTARTRVTRADREARPRQVTGLLEEATTAKTLKEVRALVEHS
jgi:hypothetical protein